MRLDPYSYFGQVRWTEERGSMLLTETAYEAGMRLPPHSHGSAHLAVLLEGSYLERSSTRTFLCLPGDAIHYGVDMHHDNVFGRRSGRCLNLEFPEGQEPELCKGNCACVPLEVATLLRSEGRSRAVAAADWLRSARALIDDSPGLSLAPLADRLCTHPNHLAKMFRKAFGLSVGQYALIIRARFASRKLIETNDSIAEIAFDSGYFDQSHFSNSFAGLTGFSPAVLRRVAQG
jgi:AraC family transcriptional regulator